MVENNKNEKTYILTESMLEAIISDLQEAPAKYVYRVISSLLSLESIEDTRKRQMGALSIVQPGSNQPGKTPEIKDVQDGGDF